MAMKGRVWLSGDVCGYEGACVAMKGRVWL